MKWMVWTALGAFIGYAGAAWVWPWWGPYVVVPCPISTPLGCWLLAAAGGLRGLAIGVKD